MSGIRWLVLGACAFLLNCGGQFAASPPPNFGSTEAQGQKQAASTSCPAEGTSVPFAKLTNTGFAKDYVGCHVKSRATFLMSGTGGKVGGDVAGYTIFQAVAPGQAASKNGLTGAAEGTWVYVPNDKADVIFNLQSGTEIEIVGGTAVEKLPYTDFLQIAVMADSVSKVEAAAAGVDTPTPAPAPPAN